MQELWIVQTNENHYEILDIFDNKEAAYECSKYYEGWIYAVFPITVISEFIKPKDID